MILFGLFSQGSMSYRLFIISIIEVKCVRGLFCVISNSKNIYIGSVIVPKGVMTCKFTNLEYGFIFLFLKKLDICVNGSH